MTYMAEMKRVGYKVIGTVKEIKGSCSAGHSVGDQVELSMHKTGGLCGALYNSIFPYVVMLQMGGSFPKEWGDQESSLLQELSFISRKRRRI